MRKPYVKKGHARLSTNGNPTGLSIPLELRESARAETYQAVLDRYPPEKRQIWNLSVIDQILENPIKYPVMYGILQKLTEMSQRQVVSTLLQQNHFAPDPPVGKKGKRRAAHFFLWPQQEGVPI